VLLTQHLWLLCVSLGIKSYWRKVVSTKIKAPFNSIIEEKFSVRDEEGGKGRCEKREIERGKRREKRGRSELRWRKAGRQVGPFATRGRPKVADARTPCPRAGRCERAVVRGTEKRGEPESGRNMVASPHAKTSRRRSPREPRLLLSTRLPTSLIKLSSALLLWHLASTGANRSSIHDNFILNLSLFYKNFHYIIIIFIFEIHEG